MTSDLDELPRSIEIAIWDNKLVTMGLDNETQGYSAEFNADAATQSVVVELISILEDKGISPEITHNIYEGEVEYISTVQVNSDDNYKLLEELTPLEAPDLVP